MSIETQMALERHIRLAVLGIDVDILNDEFAQGDKNILAIIKEMREKRIKEVEHEL